LGASQIWAQDDLGYQAPQVYFQSPGVNEVAYYTVLKSEPQGRSFSHAFLDMRRSIKEVSELQSDFLRAQENYLTSENRSNIKMWRNVTRWEHKADWSVTQREMIQIAFLRLAQLSRNPKEEVQLVERAFALDPGLKIEGLQFSPSLVAHWQEIKVAANFVELQNERFAGFSHLLINGSPYILSDAKIKLPYGTHRFTWISNQFLPVTRVLDTKHVNQVVLPQVPLVSGTCEKPVTTDGLRELMEDFVELKSAQLQIVYPEECVAGLNASAPTMKKIVEPSPFDDAISQLSTSKEEKPSAPFYKRPKFWLGSMLVSGVLLYFHQQNDRASEAPPTHREGF
jgi:hypothetical protein